MASLGELIVSINADTKGFDTGVDKTEKKTNNLAKGFGKFGKATAKVTGLLIGAGAAMVALAKSSGNYADKLLDLEQVTGLSTDTLQEFKNVATVAGVSFEGLTGIVQKFTSRLPTIEAGTSESAKAFEKLGVALKDSNGETRDANDLVPELITSLQSIENVTERNAVAQQVFGRSLGDLAPVLGMTADETKRARDEAYELGLVWSSDDIKEANNFRVEMELLTSQFQAQTRDLSTLLIPIIRDRLLPIFSTAIKKTGEFINSIENQVPLVKDKLTSTWVSFGGAVREIISKLIGAFTIFGSKIKSTWITAVNSVQIAFNNLGITIIENVLGSIIKFLDVASKIPFVGEQFGKVNDSVKGLKKGLIESSEQAKKNNEISIQLAKDEVKTAEEVLAKKVESIESETEAKLTAIEEERARLDEEKKQRELDRQAEIDAVLESEKKKKEIVVEVAEEIAEEEDKIEEKKIKSKQERLEEELALYGAYSSNLLGIFDSLYQTQLNNLDSEQNAQIEALDKKALGEEEYNKQVQAIEKETAKKKYDIELAQFNANKASSVIEAGIATALGATKALPNLILSGIVTAAGIANIASIVSAPAPPRPQLATGAFISGSQRGTEVIVGEGGSDEEIFGMGSKGAPRRKRFASEVASMVAQQGSQQIVINQSNMMNLSNEQNLQQVAELLYSRLEAVKQRRGAV
jgi:hypothetical protein